MKAFIPAVLVVALFFAVVQEAKATTITAGQIEKLLKKSGVESVATVDQSGDPTFAFRVEQFDVHLITYGCSSSGCTSLQLGVGFETDSKSSLAVMNEWNSNRRFSTAYVDSNGNAILQSDLNIEAGFTEDIVLNWLSMFRYSVIAFTKHLTGT